MLRRRFCFGSLYSGRHSGRNRAQQTRCDPSGLCTKQQSSDSEQTSTQSRRTSRTSRTSTIGFATIRAFFWSWPVVPTFRSSPDSRPAPVCAVFPPLSYFPASNSASGPDPRPGSNSVASYRNCRPTYRRCAAINHKAEEADGSAEDEITEEVEAEGTRDVRAGADVPPRGWFRRFALR